MEYYLPSSFNTINAVCSTSLETLTPIAIPYFKKIVTTYELLRESEVAEVSAALPSVPENQEEEVLVTTTTPQQSPFQKERKVTPVAL